jgi:ribosomal 50S subunit-associated protein YjgA (DUF615 family)
MTRAENSLKQIYEYLIGVEDGSILPMTSSELHTFIDKIVTEYMNEKQDAVVKQVISKFEDRSAVGIHKYGTTLEENKGDDLYWMNHLQEELMDAILYLQKLKNKQNGKRH